MLNFVQNLLNYMTFEVFESSWITFEEKLIEVSFTFYNLNFELVYIENYLLLKNIIF